MSFQSQSDASVTLREQPLTQWTNERRSGGQIGHVFVWMAGETPVAMAAIFSFPWRGVMTDRRVVHELHALAPQQLNVARGDRPARVAAEIGTGANRDPRCEFGDNFPTFSDPGSTDRSPILRTLHRSRRKGAGSFARYRGR